MQKLLTDEFLFDTYLSMIYIITGDLSQPWLVGSFMAARERRVNLRGASHLSPSFEESFLEMRVPPTGNLFNLI